MFGKHLRDETGWISSPDGGRDTPMDYDDNDFHNQNFHLAGEGSTKFPPVLRPYPLPKFDFDDSLQNHLRFDSLVETEVFLGIENNQDNHWIEDFSRGSSGIEFNSSAAESCSISRHNNVWSEATSSESVEMLLKSVGQEDIIAAPTIVEELDACDELGCLTKQMERSLKHDDNNVLSKTEDGTNLNSTLPPDEIAGNSSSSKMDVSVDLPLIEDTSQTQSDEIVKGGSSHDYHEKADNGNVGLLVTDRDILVNEKFDDVSKSGVDTLADEQPDVQIQGDSFASRLQVDNLETPVQSIILNSTGFSGNDVELQIKAVGNDDAGSQVSCREEISAVSASKVEAVSEIKETEVSKSNLEESSSEVEKGDTELPIVSESNKGECSGKPVEASNYEDVVLCKSTVGGDQREVNMIDVLPEPLKSDTHFERQVAEVSNLSSEVPSTLEPTKDFVENSCKEDVLKSRQQLDGEILVYRSGVYTPPTEDTRILEQEGLAISNSHMGGISDVSGTSSSAELCSETNITVVLKGVHDAFETARENLSSASHIPLAIITESTQIYEKNHTCGEADACISNQDVSVGEKENTKLHFDCINADSENLSKEVASSLIGDDKCAIAAGSEPVSDSSAVSNPNLATQETSNSVSLPSENVMKIDSHKDIQITAVPVVDSTLVEGKEEARTKACAESSVAASSISCQVVAATDSAFTAEEGASCVTAGGLLCKTPDLYLPTESKPEVETTSKDSAAVEVSKECTKEMDAPLYDSTGREGHVLESVIVPESQKQFIIEKHVLQDATSASELAMNKDKMLTPGGAPLFESGNNTHQKVQDGNEAATLTPGDKSSAQPDTKNNGGSSADHSVPTPGSTQLSQNKQGAEKGGKRKASVSKVIDGNAGNLVSSTIVRKGLDLLREGKTSNVSLSADLCKGDAGKNSQSFPASPAPRASPQVSDGEHVRGRSKGTSERKPRRSSVKAAGKDSAKKGVPAKETTPVRQSEKGDKLSNVSLSSPGIFHIMQSNEMQHYGHVEGNNNKSYLVLATSTSSLPDLNSSASPSTVFQQPFTDFQQVQLRAQIFVYGALIQGTPPEEGHMLSAFGGIDGGRSMWGNLWQACIERLQNQKTNLVNQETPLHSRHTTSAAARTIDQSSKQSALQSKGISTPVGRSSTKGSQAIVSPMIPLSSPLWSVSTPVGDAMQSSVMPRVSVVDYQQTLTPLHPFQTPPMRNLLGPNTSWMPQTSFRGPWGSPPQPSLPEVSTRLTTYPGTEAIQLTSVKETAVPHSSGTKHVSSSPMVQTGAPASVFTAAVSPMLEVKKATSSSGQHSIDPRPRKRKKNPVSEEIGQIILQSQPQREPVLAPVFSGSLSTSVAITTPTSTSEKLVTSVPPISSASLRKVDNVMQRAFLSEDTVSKIKEASKYAEDAASLAAAAVGHSQEIWSQLEKQRNSGLVSDVEAKLASAAVAVAAAAAVAKAAAAAANVASNAALQAKLMANEAFISNSFENLNQGTRSSFSDGANVLGKATPASILRGEDGANSSSSIITVARETARRKVEAASAASKRAENMDAIVRAAELAAEAVSQAGKIVAMGDPMPLSELIEAGPEGYWRTPQVSSALVAKSVAVDREQSKSGAGEGAHTPAKHSKDGRSVKRESEKSTIPRGMSKESIEEHLRLVDGISGSAAVSEKEMKGHKGRKVSDLTKNIVVVLESDSLSKLSSIEVENEVEKAEDVPGENGIKESSKVEVYKDGDGFKAGWYAANVLSLNDGKACVSYTEIEQGEGSTELKEWVALEGSDPPKIRIARPVTAMRYEGTRKRRRAAMGDYNWSVGDKVDAWMTNSWWEGLVTERNKKDETSVTVHFPAHGETSAVKAWHLRPSLIWKDGEWVECSNLQTDSSSLGDLPQEKRLKIGSPAMEAKGKDKMSKSTDILDSGKHQSRLLDLSANDKVFKMGKNARNETKPDTTRVARTGLQKEGSRVVFGVPKPGKKRKFMEVSKHYVADRSNKNNEANDSLKYLKYTAPQGSGSRAVKNDSKEKRVAESKIKGLKSGKQQSVSGRTIPQRNFTTNAVSISGASEGTTGELTARDKDSLSNVDDTSRKQNVMESASFSTSDGTAEGTFVFSSGVPTLDGPSKKSSVSTARVERANKGKLAPASGKLGKIDEDKAFNGNSFKSTSEAVEPRRSNRRIQPTSRLLEGLQSSLVIPKFPSLSHDKGPRAQNRNTPRGNNHG